MTFAEASQYGISADDFVAAGGKSGGTGGGGGSSGGGYHVGSGGGSSGGGYSAPHFTKFMPDKDPVTGVAAPHFTKFMPDKDPVTGVAAPHFTKFMASGSGGWTAGGSLVGTGDSDTTKETRGPFSPAPGILPMSRMIKSQDDIAKEAAKAAGSWKSYSIGIAYAARHILAGGGGGMVGGAAGFGIGAMTGPQSAYLGMILGSAIGQAGQGFLESGTATINKAGAASPSAAFRRERAELDRTASEGRLYMDSYEKMTELERDWADFHHAGGKVIGGALMEGAVGLYNLENRFHLNAYKMLTGVNPTPGESVGAAPDKNAGQVMSSGLDLWKNFASSALRQSAGDAFSSKAAPAQDMLHLAIDDLANGMMWAMRLGGSTIR